MTICETQPRAPRPRRFQFTLRTMMGVMLLACVGMSWVAFSVQNARRQKLAVAAILVSGGSVQYRYQLENRSDQDPLGTKAEPPGPDWLRNMLGVDFLAEVVSATVTTDEAIENVGALSQLDEVYLCGAKITDIGLERLKAPARLRDLVAFQSEISDQGLESLKQLTQLTVISLCENRGITKQGVERLQRSLPDCQIRSDVPTADSPSPRAP